jgi:hypothetical protein
VYGRTERLLHRLQTEISHPQGEITKSKSELQIFNQRNPPVQNIKSHVRRDFTICETKVVAKPDQSLLQIDSFGDQGIVCTEFLFALFEHPEHTQPPDCFGIMNE